MSTTIDQRVVEMRFENKQFESNVATSMSTLSKLKQALNLNGATKGLADIDAAAKKVDMGSLGSAVDTIHAKFSALQVVGVTALSNIANQAVNATKKMAAAFTIDPIKTGFQEYETQIGAIQTILANTESKGTTLSDVNSALDTLNTYADKTIYNFTEMTRNIGTFTAAGVDLDKSVASIQGIANLAAVSGSTSQQASTAMYQLSQALAAGRVSLMDWNSVVNAGMGGQVFQDALKRTSEAMGTGAEAAIKQYGSFRESLTKGKWLTTDVLTKTLEQFTMAAKEGTEEWEKYKKSLMDDGYSEKQAIDILKMANTATDAATKVKTFSQLFDTLKEAAQSGWTQTWELLIGDFGEAKDLLTEISDTIGGIIGKSAESRNKVLAGGLQSNWSKLTSKIEEAGIETSVFEEKISQVAKKHNIDIDSIVQEHGSLQKAFKEGAISSDILMEAVDGLGSSLANLSKIDRTLKKGSTGDDVKELQQALSDLGHDIGDTGVDGILGANTEAAIKAFQELKGLEVTGIVDDKTLKALKEATGDTKNLSKECKKLIDNITKNGGRENLIDALRNSFKALMSVINPIKEAFSDVFPAVTSKKIYDITKNIKDFSKGLILSGDKAKQVKRIFEGVFSIFDIAKKIVTPVIESLFNLGKSDGIASLADFILEIAASIGDLFTAINKGLDNSGIAGALDGIVSGISNILTGTFGGLDSFVSFAKSVGDTIADVFNSIWDNVSKVFTWISDNISAGDVFSGLAGTGVFLAFNKLKSVFGKVETVIDKLFGKKGVGNRINELGNDFAEMLGSIKDALVAFSQGIKVGSLLGIAASVALLVSAISDLSKLKLPDIAKSVGTIAVLFGIMVGAFKLLSKSLSIFPAKGIVKTSFSLVLMAKAVEVLADAIVTIGNLSLEKIAKGLIGVGGGLFILTRGAKAINGVKIPLSTSISLLALAKSCEMLGDALTKFGEMAWDEIGRGLTAMGGALIEFVAAIAVLNKFGGFKSLLGSASILIAVQSLDELSENLKKFGKMAWDEIGRGLTAMGGALTELGAVIGLLGKITGFSGIFGATSILIGVQALDELSENLKRFGAMKWDEIGRGLTAMGAALVELGAVFGTLGYLTGFGGVVGATAILIGVQALDEISVNLEKFGAMAWDEIGRGLVAMGGALTELGTVFGLLGYLTGFGGILGAGSIVLGVQGLDELANALQKFGTMTWDEIKRGLVAMGGALTELGVVSGTLGTLAPFGALVGSGSLVLAVQGLDELANALIKFGSMSWDEIKHGLVAMGGALGEIAAGGILNTLSIIGSYSISEMAAPLGVLADSVKKWKDVEVPENLGKQLGALGRGLIWFNFSESGASAIATSAPAVGIMADSVKKWSNVTIPEGLVKNLKTLAQGVRKFTFAGLGGNALETAAPAVGVLADSVKKWSNVTVPENLNENLKGLADGVKAFSWAFMGGWSLSAVAGPLGELAGDISKWKNVSIPETLPKQLKGLSSAVKSFSWVFMGGWSLSAISGPLGSLAKDIKKWNDVSIPTNLPKQLKSLASAVLDFSFAFVGGWSLSAITGPLGKLAGSIKKWNGVTIPTGLGKQLKSLAGGVKAFSGAKDISTATNGLKSIASSATKLSGVDFKSIASGLSKLSTALVTFATSSGSLSGVGSTIVKNIVNPIKKANSQLSEAGKGLINALAKSIRTKTSTITSAMNSIVSKMVSALNNKKQQFNSAGVKLVAQIAAGIKKSSSKVKSAIGSVMKSSISSIKGYYDNFESAGKSLVNGFAAGISANTFKAEAKARAMANAAEEAARKALDINSPSKVFRALGYSVPEGFAMGIDRLSKMVTKSSVGMTDRAVMTVSSSISRIADIVNNNIDAQPTIRPVLDLSNVRSGASSINGMLSGRATLTVGTRTANTIANSMSNRQNGNSGEIVSAIKALGNDISSMPRESISINGITYDDGSNINDAVRSIVREARMGRRV